MGNGKIEFEPIPGESGYIALTIYPPGTFIGNKHYDVFVGGSGVGDRMDVESARKYLLYAAIRECDRRIESAMRTLTHYAGERAKLIQNGLKEKGDVQAE